jgi:hypothetical protein
MRTPEEIQAKINQLRMWQLDAWDRYQARLAQEEGDADDGEYYATPDQLPACIRLHGAIRALRWALGETPMFPPPEDDQDSPIGIEG